MTPEEALLKSLPSVRKSAEDAAWVQAMRETIGAPLFRSLLEVVGGDLNKLDRDLEKALKASDELDAHYREVATFNRYFTNRGWIYYDPMSLEVVKRINAVAAEGDLDAAETLIVAYYDEKHLRFLVNWMKYAKAFQPRRARANQALEDHLAGRYDATVLALIPVIDGMVQDAHEQHRGFFSNGTDLTAWDSIVAHDQGLMKLARIFSKTRTRTNNEPLTLPYRHGIVHGTDLNFGNRMVATKLWALLFALRDWVLKSERGELNAPPPKPEPTPVQSIAKLLEGQQDLAAIRAWEPRNLVFGQDLPVTGTPDLYEAGMPERMLVTMLCAWQAKNYGAMSECMCWSFRQLPKRTLFNELRTWLAKRPLADFSLERLLRERPGCVDIVTTLRFVDEPEQSYTATFQLMCETSTGKPSFEGAADAHWGLLAWNPPTQNGDT